MGSAETIESYSESPRFSDCPALHYFLTIFFTLLIFDIYQGASTYYCLVSGNNYECDYDPERLKELGVIGSQTFFTFDPSSIVKSLLITLLFNALQLPLWLVASAPVYLVALYAGRHYCIQRNLAGIIFWIVAWTIATLSLSFLGAIQVLLSDPGYVSWHSDFFGMLIPGSLGVVRGIVYCFFAFRSNAAVAAS
jgi:hypothetical protein